VCRWVCRNEPSCLHGLQVIGHNATKDNPSYRLRRCRHRAEQSIPTTIDCGHCSSDALRKSVYMHAWCLEGAEQERCAFPSVDTALLRACPSSVLVPRFISEKSMVVQLQAATNLASERLRSAGTILEVASRCLYRRSTCRPYPLGDASISATQEAPLVQETPLVGGFHQL
jgi:hypothetical protein